MSKIKGLDDIDAMFPGGPIEEDENGDQNKDKVKRQVKKPAAAKKTGNINKDAGEDEQNKEDPKEDPKTDPSQKEPPPAKDNDDPSSEEEAGSDDNTFFVETKKALFTETHSQENIWLEKQLKKELDEIFKDKPKGFKTKFYNAALKFAVGRYKAHE